MAPQAWIDFIRDGSGMVPVVSDRLVRSFAHHAPLATRPSRLSVIVDNVLNYSEHDINDGFLQGLLG